MPPEIPIALVCFVLFEDFAGDLLGELAAGEGDDPREAARMLRERVMDVRKEIRDPKTGRLL